MDQRITRQSKGARKGTEQPQESKSAQGTVLKIVFAVVAVMLLIAVAILVIYLFSGESAKTYNITTFSSGSDNIVLGGKFESSKGSISIPKDATVTDFKFNITGTYPFPVEKYDVGVNPTSMVSDDLDLDGDWDLVVLNSDDDSVSILKNIGNGRFLNHSEYKAPANSSQVITVKLNSDEYPDIAIIGVSKMVDVFLANNDPVFDFTYDGPHRYMISNYSYSLCALDYDQDGDNDLAATCKNSRTLDLLTNQGDGSFVNGAVIPIENSPGEIVAGELSGDGYPDLVIINRGDRDNKLNGKAWHYTVSVLLNKNGAFPDRVDYGVGRTPSALALSDLNLDGALDIVVANEGDLVNQALAGMVSVLINDGNGIFPSGDSVVVGAKLYEATDPNDVICSDLNGDAYPDIITACRSTDTINVFFNKDMGQDFVPYKNYFVGYSPKSIFAADYDNDGDNDIATSNTRALDRQSSNGSVSILRNYGYGIFSTDREFKTGNVPRGVVTTDLNNDGSPDISTANYFGSTLTALINNGQGDFGSRQDYLLGLEPYAIVSADFDGDGFMDVAAMDEARFVVILLFNDRTGHFKTERPFYDINGYPFSLHADDYDGDGDVDIIMPNHGQRTLSILNNTGDGTFEPYWSIDLGYRMAFDAAYIDVNKDGIRDIITANLGTDSNYTNTVSVMFGNGKGSFYAPVDYIVGFGPTALITEDLNNDGALDIGATCLASGTMAILLNNGDGNFEDSVSYTVGKRPYFLKAIEIDGDGFLDVVVSNSDSNSLTFLRNDGRGGFVQIYEKTTGSYPYYMAIDYLTGDERPDIVVTNVNAASVSVISDYYYPSDVKIDLDGNPNPPEYSLPPGELKTTVRTPDLSSEVQKYLESHQHLADGDGNIQVPITVIMGKSGMVTLSDIELTYER